MMDDATLERGLRARPPADPAYVSGLPAMAPAIDPGSKTHTGIRGNTRMRGVPSTSWLLAAIAIVAVSVGALAFLTRQNALIGPAATPSSSPSPARSLAPASTTAPTAPASPDEFAGFVTREVEPGVHRIDDDGLRSLAWSPSRELGSSCCHFARSIAIGPDGAVWFLRPDAYFQLGADTSLRYDDAIDDRMRHLVVTGSGEATRLWRDGGGMVLSTAPSHDGNAWREEHEGGLLAVATDGSVWTIEQVAEDARLWRGGHGEWVVQPDPDWPGSDARPIGGPWVDDTGSVWLSRGASLVRFVNGAWEHLLLPSGDAIAVDVGSDGTVWVWTGTDWSRYQDSSWATFGTDVPPLGRVGGHAMDPVVAPDGSLWYSPDHQWRGCDGLVRFDGVTVSRYLTSLCVYGIEAGQHGTLWVLAGDDYRADPLATVAVYAIPPEARMPG